MEGEWNEDEYYKQLMQRLSKIMIAKGRKFNKLKLVEYKAENWYLVKPLPRNKRTYNVTRSMYGGAWSCECEWAKNVGGECSHIAAVALAEMQRREHDPIYQKNKAVLQDHFELRDARSSY